MQGKLHGIITCESGKMDGLKTEPIAWSTDVKKLVALCHGLVPLSKGKVVGRLDEQKAFACVEAAFLVSLVLHMYFGSVLVGFGADSRTCSLHIPSLCYIAAVTVVTADMIQPVTHAYVSTHTAVSALLESVSINISISFCSRLLDL
jgi:hypothetical protein